MLNTISSHVERNSKLTRRMIEHLGDLLRMSRESQGRQEVLLLWQQLQCRSPSHPDLAGCWVCADPRLEKIVKR